MACKKFIACVKIMIVVHKLWELLLNAALVLDTEAICYVEITLLDKSISLILERQMSICHTLL